MAVSKLLLRLFALARSSHPQDMDPSVQKQLIVFDFDWYVSHATRSSPCSVPPGLWQTRTPTDGYLKCSRLICGAR